MDEKKETQEQGSKDSGDGDKSKTVGTLDRADEIAERQKRENDRREDLLVREEQLEARKKVGGETEAGKEAPKEKEETDSEYRQKVEKDLAEGKYNR